MSAKRPIFDSSRSSFATERRKERINWASEQVDKRGGYLIIVGRFIPGGRTVITLAAGAGLCDLDAVKVLVDEGPRRVEELIALGAEFDRDERG